MRLEWGLPGIYHKISVNRFAVEFLDLDFWVGLKSISLLKVPLPFSVLQF